MSPHASSGGGISLRLCLCFPANPIHLPAPKGNQYCECWVYCSFAFSKSFHHTRLSVVCKCVMWYRFPCGLRLAFLALGCVSSAHRVAASSCNLFAITATQYSTKWLIYLFFCNGLIQTESKNIWAFFKFLSCYWKFMLIVCSNYVYFKISA